MAQGAIQGAKYVASTRSRPSSAGADPAEREPFQYFDKGSMATVSRFSAVAKIGPLEFSGFIAWLAWLVLHLVYLVGFKTKITTLLSWTVTFLSTRRGQLTITEQQAFARTRLEQLAVLAAEAQAAGGQAWPASRRARSSTCHQGCRTAYSRWRRRLRGSRFCSRTWPRATRRSSRR